MSKIYFFKVWSFKMWYYSQWSEFMSASCYFTHIYYIWTWCWTLFQPNAKRFGSIPFFFILWPNSNMFFLCFHVENNIKIRLHAQTYLTELVSITLPFLFVIIGQPDNCMVHAKFWGSNCNDWYESPKLFANENNYKIWISSHLTPF